MRINSLFKVFRGLGIALMISLTANAQQPNPLADKFEEFKILGKVQDQEKFYNDLIKKQPINTTNQKIYNAFRAELAINWLSQENIEKYREYRKTTNIDNGLQLFELTNVLEPWADDKKHLDWITEISNEFIPGLESGAIKDEFERAHEILLEISALSDSYNGHTPSALEKIQKALLEPKMRDMNYFKDSKPNFINRYAIILAASGQDQKAIDTLSAAVRNAESNPRLLATLKSIYEKVHPGESEKYATALQTEAYQHYYNELEANWEANGKSAPDVVIYKLNGKNFKVSDYKGKILVIDFWSTICKPCIAAFPAFERVAAEYKDQPFQLYVTDIAEDQESVQAYVDHTRLALDVLRDPDMKLFKAIGAKGTPHKFIIDPQGVIRMQGIGYAGSSDREYYKLKAMVEITKKHAAINN
ncbi:TlpA disulfide reductase family protein [Chitinophaga sp.]|uniref:TlpA family protein disulfide reductase n=1 Tax=Chitinophaga sp. TaxID=1869181 RepID=UPI0031E3214B